MEVVMRLKKAFIMLMVLSLSAVIAATCGGAGDETKPTAVLATLAPQATTAPAPTASAAAPGATSTPLAVTGTILDKALPYFPYELDNVRYGGTLRTNLIIFPPHFDPKLNNQAIVGIMRYNSEKLVNYVPNEKDLLSHFEPWLAEKWETSGDLKTYTVTLRKGVRWHNIAPVNGRELVASDVVFSLKRYMEKDSIVFSNYQFVEAVEAPDKYTVVIKLKFPNAWAINDLFSTTEYVVAPEVVAAHGGTIPSTAGIGTGPYIIKDYAFNTRVRLTRNPDYWKKDSKGQTLPYIDDFEIIYAINPATLLAGMRTNQFDTLSNNADVIALGKSRPDVRVARTEFFRISGSFSFNSQRAPWNDVRVRRAFNMALDKDKYGGLISATPNWIHIGVMPWSLVSDEPFTVDKLGPYYKYSPQESKRLRIEAGFPDGKIKVPTPFTIANSPSFSVRAQTYQALFKQEGIEFEIETLDFSTYSPYYYQRQYKDIAITYDNGNDFTLNWVAQNKFQRDNSQNTAKIDDPEVERVVREIKLTTDPAKLREFARFLWDYEAFGVYNIWTPVELSNLAISPRLRNYTVRSGSAFFGHYLMPWLADSPRTSP
jgi:peptide/nickel transport system substrate-binding protein